MVFWMSAVREKNITVAFIIFLYYLTPANDKYHLGFIRFNVNCQLQNKYAFIFFYPAKLYFPEQFN